MNTMQLRGPDSPLQAGRDGDAPHRLRAVVATYRPTLQAYTLAVSPAELMALSALPAEMAGGVGGTCDPRAHAHLARLRGEVQASGIALRVQSWSRSAAAACNASLITSTRCRCIRAAATG